MARAPNDTLSCRPEARLDACAVLGVGRDATAAEIRRAYRRLALKHHPDRAGPGSTGAFQRLAAAYALLSDDGRRAAPDRPRRTAAAGGPRAAAPAPEVPATLVGRLCGPLAALAARGALRVCADGTVELFLTPDERAAGGFACISARLPVSCPTCGGLADRHGFRCARCVFAGVVIDLVTLWVALPPGLPDGAELVVPVDPIGHVRPLRFRVRQEAPTP